MWSESSKDQIPVLALASPALSLVTLNVNNDQGYDEIHGISITKRKTNGDLLSKKKILEECADVFDKLDCLPGELHLEVHKSIRPVQHVPWKIPVAMREKINWAENSSKSKWTNWLDKQHDCWQETTKQQTLYLYWSAWF